METRGARDAECADLVRDVAVRRDAIRADDGERDVAPGKKVTTPRRRR